jgi:hypothetical protein
MKKEIRRREFLSGCFKAGAACFLVAGSGDLLAMETYQDKKPNPKDFEYCGFKCPATCTLKKATLENNTEMKKKAYAEFRLKEKYNLEFDPDKVFCYGCKVKDKPLGPPVTNCKVRQCVIDKKLECCIECNDLAKCDKELWKEFPDFRKNVIELQKKYKS